MLVMTAKQVEKLILAKGWEFVRQCGAHRKYKHRDKKGNVTIPFHTKPEDLNYKVLKSIFQQAGLDIKEYL